LKDNRTTPHLLDYVAGRLSALPPMELERVTYEFVDFLLDEAIQENPKSVAGSSYYVSTLSPAQIQHYGGILDSMIWNDKLISFNRMLLALADRDDDLNSFSFLEYFLIQSQHPGTFIQRFLSCQINPQTWLETNCYFKMSEYFKECPPSQCQFKDQKLYPIYFGNFPLRLLPILDCLIMRFIETNRWHLILGLLNENKYTLLYRYHEAPATFVKELLHYYYPLLYPDVITALLKLVACNPEVKLSSELARVRENIIIQGDSMEFPENFEQAIEQHIVLPLYSITKTSSPSLSPSEPLSVPFHTFKEFPTRSDRVLTTAVIELLLFPHSYECVTRIVGAILQPIKSLSKLRTLNASKLNTMGLLLASLPRVFDSAVLMECCNYLHNDQLLNGFSEINFDGPVGNPLSRCSYTDQGGNPDPILSNRANAVLTLLHSFFHYSTIEVFEHFPALVAQLGRERKSYHDLYILCRMVAPWVYRIAANIHLMNNIIMSLFEYLKDVDQLCSEIMFDIYCDISQCSTNPNSILWLQDVIVDFLFHLNSFSSETLSDPQAQESVASSIDCMSPPTKAKFRYFFHK